MQQRTAETRRHGVVWFCKPPRLSSSAVCFEDVPYLHFGFAATPGDSATSFGKIIGLLPSGWFCWTT
jgi:hypothetical protein